VRLEAPEQVRAAELARDEARELDLSPAPWAAPAARAREWRAIEQGARVLEGVEVQVEIELADAHARRVAPGERALGVDGMRRLVEAGAQRV